MMVDVRSKEGEELAEFLDSHANMVGPSDVIF